MKCHHYCNCELTCPECQRRFWKWAENHTRRGPFYEAASAHLREKVATSQPAVTAFRRVVSG